MTPPSHLGGATRLWITGTAAVAAVASCAPAAPTSHPAAPQPQRAGHVRVVEDARRPAPTRTTERASRSHTRPPARPSRSGPDHRSSPSTGRGTPAELRLLACIAHHESGGNYRAENDSSSASGRYQFIASTWRAVTGLEPPASAYPPAVQDAAALKLLRTHGIQQWSVWRRCA